MEQSEDKKHWIVLGAVSAVLAMGFGYMIYHQHEELKKSRTEAEQLDVTIKQDRKLIKGTPDLVKTVIVHRETDAVIKEILSDTTDSEDFVRTLDRFAEESGFKLDSAKKQNRTNRRAKEEFERVGYRLNFEADAFQFLAFLHKIESFARFISVTNIKMRAAGRATLDGDDVPLHSVSMDLETYVYVPHSDAKETRIDRYEHKRDLLIGQISEKTSALRVPEYTYRGRRGRRAPWIDPRTPAAGAATIPIPEQLAIVEGLAAQAQDVREAWDIAREADNVIEAMRSRTILEEKLALIEEEIRRVQAEETLTYINAERRFNREVVQVVADVRTQMSSDGGGLGPGVAQLRETAEAMDRHIEAFEYELALQAYATVEGKLAIAERDPKKVGLVKNLRFLRSVARNVIEFEMLEIQIQGVALHEDMRAVVLIGGRAFTEGELVGPDLIVHHIRTDQVEFMFRGMIFARILDPDPREKPQ